jgi:hypothetical protein
MSLPDPANQPVQYTNDWLSWAGDRLAQYFAQHPNTGPFQYKLPVQIGSDRYAAWRIDWDNFLSGTGHQTDFRSDGQPADLTDSEILWGSFDSGYSYSYHSGTPSGQAHFDSWQSFPLGYPQAGVYYPGGSIWRATWAAKPSPRQLTKNVPVYQEKKRRKKRGQNPQKGSH